jgi:hypothetical protein
MFPIIDFYSTTFVCVPHQSIRVTTGPVRTKRRSEKQQQNIQRIYPNVPITPKPKNVPNIQRHLKGGYTQHIRCQKWVANMLWKLKTSSFWEQFSLSFMVFLVMLL